MVLPFFAPSERPHARSERMYLPSFLAHTWCSFASKGSILSILSIHISSMLYTPAANRRPTGVTAVQLRRSANSQSMQCSQHSVDTGSRLSSSLSCYHGTSGSGSVCMVPSSSSGSGLGSGSGSGSNSPSVPTSPRKDTTIATMHENTTRPCLPHFQQRA